MLSHWLSKVVCNVLGNFYAAYASYQAVKSRDPAEYKQWLTFWVVNACFIVTEYFADSLVSWVPLYYELKIAFVVWLTLPQFSGATIIYDRVVKRYLEQYEEQIDAHLETMHTAAASAMQSAGTYAGHHVRTASSQILVAAAQTMSSLESAAAAAASAPASPAAPQAAGVASTTSGAR